MSQDALPGFSGTCKYPAAKAVHKYGRSREFKNGRDTPICLVVTDDPQLWEQHMLEVHGIRPHQPPTYARPNHGRWRGPRVKDDPAKLAEVAQRAAPIEWWEPVPSAHLSHQNHQRFTGQWWCDAWSKSIWVVPDQPMPDGELLVRLEPHEKWHEQDRVWDTVWRRVGAWSAPKSKQAAA